MYCKDIAAETLSFEKNPLVQRHEI